MENTDSFINLQLSNKKMEKIILLMLIVVLIISCSKTPEINKTEEANKTSVVEKIQEVKKAPEINKMYNRALLETTIGNIKIELFDTTMPITSGNFKKLVSEGFYDGVIFHRVIPSFMIQGGDPIGTGAGGPGYKIKDEFTSNNKNDRGTISMANAGPNTGGSQFFINLVNNNFLDKKHPVFGKVIEGMDVVDAISKVERDSRDKPLTHVVINRASMISK